MTDHVEADARPDDPRGGWFKRHHDAVHQAHFRAALVRRRYRVHYDPANRWWNITETPESFDE